MNGKAMQPEGESNRPLLWPLHDVWNLTGTQFAWRGGLPASGCEGAGRPAIGAGCSERLVFIDGHADEKAAVGDLKPVFLAKNKKTCANENSRAIVEGFADETQIKKSLEAGWQADLTGTPVGAGMGLLWWPVIKK